MPRLHHLALRTGDVPSLASFYTRVLGLEPVRETERASWLRAGEVVVMIEGRAEGEPPPPAGTMELLAFRWEGDLPDARKHLEARGIAVEGCTEFTLYFRDPEGRRVGLSVYPFDELT